MDWSKKALRRLRGLDTPSGWLLVACLIWLIAFSIQFAIAGADWGPSDFNCTGADTAATGCPSSGLRW